MANARARDLRKNLTDAERRLWSRLRRDRLGAHFRRQHPIGPYIVDFTCLEARLVVECDGGQHADSDHDARRDAYLARNGYRVLRFWNYDVLQQTDVVVEEIWRALRAPCPLPSPPPRPSGGGRE